MGEINRSRHGFGARSVEEEERWGFVQSRQRGDERDDEERDEEEGAPSFVLDFATWTIRDKAGHKRKSAERRGLCSFLHRESEIGFGLFFFLFPSLLLYILNDNRWMNVLIEQWRCVLTRGSKVGTISLYIYIYIFRYWRDPNPLGWTNPFGPRGKPGRFPCSPSVVVQFRTHNLRIQTVVLSQLS